jgi:hypothetical protein
LSPVQCLNAVFLIHAQHQGFLGRAHVEAYDFKKFFFKAGIRAEVKCSEPMWMEIMFSQNGVNEGFEKLQFFCQGAAAPAAQSFWRFTTNRRYDLLADFGRMDRRFT